MCCKEDSFDLTWLILLVSSFHASTYMKGQKHEEEVNVITFFRGMQIGDVVDTNDICNLAIFAT